ncbi:MAG TPA: hypothetical protein VKP65_21540 [Rhodothermales bacterium]|nr:hypothetical protein [Rhodothermales bacterium]
MTRVPYLVSTLCVLLLMFVSTAATTNRGGFELRAEHPAADNAILMVHTYGCDQPARAKVTGTAEGRVAGKRQSIPLKLKATATGVYAVEWEQPAEGDWVLTLRGAYRGHISSLLVTIDDKGQAVLPEPDQWGRRIEPLRRNLTDADIERALKQHKHKG